MGFADSLTPSATTGRHGAIAGPAGASHLQNANNTEHDCNHQAGDHQAKRPFLPAFTLAVPLFDPRQRGCLLAGILVTVLAHVAGDQILSDTLEVPAPWWGQMIRPLLGETYAGSCGQAPGVLRLTAIQECQPGAGPPVWCFGRPSDSPMIVDAAILPDRHASQRLVSQTKSAGATARRVTK